MCVGTTQGPNMNSTKFCAQLTKRLLLTASNRHKTAKVVGRNFTASRVDATEWSSNVYSNPMRELQPLLQVPLTSLAEEIFNPSEREIGAGHEMLRRTDHNISLYKGEIRPESLPELNLPEVCFAGRSNVGKSSLIGSLLNNNQIVTKKFKVSNTPGFTKCLRLVQVKRMFSLVDMPGYGENMPPDFVDMVEGYLQTREQLSAVFLLVDGNDGFHSVDQTAIEMLEEYGKPYAVVMTKIDKSTPHTTLRNILSFVELSKKMPSCFPQPFLVSSLHGYGIAYLQTYLLYTMGIFAIKGL